jgi:hypothetical protein
VAAWERQCVRYGSLAFHESEQAREFAQRGNLYLRVDGVALVPGVDDPGLVELEVCERERPLGGSSRYAVEVGSLRSRRLAFFASKPIFELVRTFHILTFVRLNGTGLIWC